jgi:hypothetical protein
MRVSLADTRSSAIVGVRDPFAFDPVCRAGSPKGLDNP